MNSSQHFKRQFARAGQSAPVGGISGRPQAPVPSSRPPNLSYENIYILPKLIIIIIVLLLLVVEGWPRVSSCAAAAAKALSSTAAD